MPCLYWAQGVETAPSLKRTGIERLCVPPDQADAWSMAGFSAQAVAPADLAAREKLMPPGISARAETVSATRSPWVFSNGWRFLRNSRGKYLYVLPAGKAPLAAAEAFSYGADALLQIDPADVEALGQMLAFLGQLPVQELPSVADFAVVDDGSPLVGEVMNLLVRRNLLFSVVAAPSSQFPINVRVGTKEYPKKEAADPSAFALKIRRQLTDERRSLRIYGSEGVVARLTGNATRARLHLLNYGGREIEGLRIRLQGNFRDGAALVAGTGRVALEEIAVESGAIEFSLPRAGLYAVVDVGGEANRPASVPQSDRPPAARGLRQEEDDLRGRQAFEMLSGPFDAFDEEGVVQGVACGPASGQHRHAEHVRDGTGGTRVHDVGIPRAAALEPLLGAAGDREGTVPEAELQGDRARVSRVLDADVPSLEARRRPKGEERAASGTDEGGFDPVATQQIDGSIDRVTLPNPTHVQLDPGAVEANGPRGGIELDVPVADPVPHLEKLDVRRDAPASAEETPGLHQGSDGDVERTVGLAAVPQAFGDEVEQLGVHGDGTLGRLAVETRKRAVGLVVAHQPIDAVHFVERSLHVTRERLGVAPIGDDGVGARHRHAARLVAEEPRPRHRPQREPGGDENGKAGRPHDPIVREEPSALPRAAAAQSTEAGRRHYEVLCTRCHGSDGRGGVAGPPIAHTLASRSDEELATLIREGMPRAGMPGFAIPDDDMLALLAFLRELRPSRDPKPVRGKVATTEGGRLEGMVMNQGAVDMQMLTDDRRLHILRRAGDRYRPVTSEVGWTTYNGQAGGSRYSTLDQITSKNVSRLAPRWVFTLAETSRLEVTPIVLDGVMYVTRVNECYALDAGSGRPIWHYERPQTRGLAGDAAGGINRGVAVAGERVFMVTDHAHLLALDRFTGRLLWDTEMADWRENYGATSAPLAVGGLVVSGTSGGDEGIRGFLAAFDQATGKEVWRFWTVPKRGEPGSETWRGKDIDHPCASTWLTGTYDAELDTLYWPTGNPCPDYDGDERLGDNLYSDSILALDPKTGALKWYFQYTPHDLWDWDAQQTPALVDWEWEGRPRKLLLHANRNGFFYVLDRTDGTLLLAKPFVKKLTWAREIRPDGRPVPNPKQEPTPEGTKVCPAVEGATNWFSTAFNPATGLYYVQALEKCTVYRKTPEEWRSGRSYYGGSTSGAPDETAQKVLRAIDVKTGAIAWELPQAGRANSWGGTLTSAGGLVFYGDDDGSFAAVDASTGQSLWGFQANSLWKASPMTYMFDGRQHVAVAAGPNVISFALVD
jgi:alcohol dehydrogenase (cytochrome c)